MNKTLAVGVGETWAVAPVHNVGDPAFQHTRPTPLLTVSVRCRPTTRRLRQLTNRQLHSSAPSDARTTPHVGSRVPHTLQLPVALVRVHATRYWFQDCRSHGALGTIRRGLIASRGPLSTYHAGGLGGSHWGGQLAQGVPRRVVLLMEDQRKPSHGGTSPHRQKLFLSRGGGVQGVACDSRVQPTLRWGAKGLQCHAKPRRDTVPSLLTGRQRR